MKGIPDTSRTMVEEAQEPVWTNKRPEGGVGGNRYRQWQELVDRCASASAILTLARTIPFFSAARAILCQQGLVGEYAEDKGRMKERDGVGYREKEWEG